MSTGDILNGPYAERAKEYVWSTMRDCFPRGITPTDVDSLIEISGCFLLFEGKTAGSKIEKGQGLAFKRMLLEWPEGRAVVVLGEHAALDAVDVDRDLLSIRWAWRSGRVVVWSLPLPGSMRALAKLYVRDATAGRLRPERWYGELTGPFDAEHDEAWTETQAAWDALEVPR